MPELPSASNLWDTAPRMEFDHLGFSYQDYARVVYDGLPLTVAGR